MIEADFAENQEDLEKGKLGNLMAAGAMGLGLLSSANVQADASHVGKYMDSLNNVPGVKVQKLNKDPNINAAHHNIHVGKFRINVRAFGGGSAPISNHEISMHGPKQDTWSQQDHQDHANAKYLFSHFNESMPKLMELKRSIEEQLEPLQKKCPRCGKTSANRSNPSGRCSSCLKKLKNAKKTPGHWQRAQTKADDALRRQDGKNGTASHKSSGRGSRKSIVKQTQRAEKRTGQKLSPDRKDNGKGYAASNTRMVPEHLNRGRHKVDGKKLASWKKRLKKCDIDCEDLYVLLLVKANGTPLEQHIKDLDPEQLLTLLDNVADTAT